MFGLNKTTLNAIVIAGLVAQEFKSQTPLKSIDIAQKKGLSPTVVANVLCQLSRAGIVYGQPGVSGGYKMSKSPEQIMLIDIIHIFENLSRKRQEVCDWQKCNLPNECPLLQELGKMNEQVYAIMEKITLQSFVTADEPLSIGMDLSTLDSD